MHSLNSFDGNPFIIWILIANYLSAWHSWINQDDSDSLNRLYIDEYLHVEPFCVHTMSVDFDYWHESTPSCGIKFRIGSQRCRSWEPEQVYPRPQNRRKLGRRASSVVACFWGGQKTRRFAKRSESFSERQTYRPVYWKSLDISVTVPDGSLKRVSCFIDFNSNFCWNYMYI